VISAWASDPGINGALWDVNRIDITAQQGTWERWTVRSDMPQSFHIEGVNFLIRNVNGAMPFPEDAAGKIPSGWMGRLNCWSITVSLHGRTSRSCSTARRWR
jgi:FtsP/CotA-like multicopper oxidase with cupredoxin domain